MADAPRQETVIAEDSSHNFGLNVPLLVSVAHDELAEAEMFRMAFIIDGIELRGDPYRPGRSIKETLVVDLVEMEPSQTRLRVVPRRNLSYDQFHEYVGYLLERVRASTGRNARLMRLSWEVRDRTDERGSRGRIV